MHVGSTDYRPHSQNKRYDVWWKSQATVESCCLQLQSITRHLLLPYAASIRSPETAFIALAMAWTAYTTSKRQLLHMGAGHKTACRNKICAGDIGATFAWNGAPEPERTLFCRRSESSKDNKVGCAADGTLTCSIWHRKEERTNA